jgi:hypothetical protein
LKYPAHGTAEKGRKKLSHPLRENGKMFKNGLKEEDESI